MGISLRLEQVMDSIVLTLTLLEKSFGRSGLLLEPSGTSFGR